MQSQPLIDPREKIANYNDCNSQFLIGFATVVKILQWLYSILQQLYNATSCLHLHLFVNTFNTTLSQQLYNNCIQKHNRITIFQLAVRSTVIASACRWMNKLTIKQLLNSEKHLQTGFIAYCMGVSKYDRSKPLTRKTVWWIKSNFMGLLPECGKDQWDCKVVNYYVVHTLYNA